MFENFDTNTDKLIMSCILYSFLKTVSSSDTSSENNFKSLVKSYISLFKNNFIMYKKQAITYNIIVKRIEGYRKNSFLEFTGKEIDDVNILYQNKTQLVPFSTSSFSQYMYKVASINFTQYRRLSTIHFDVMSPIIKHYRDNNGIEETDMEIYDAELYTNNPGKGIYFAIKGVPNARIVSDIKSNRIAINDKVYSIEVRSPYVKIVIK